MMQWFSFEWVFISWIISLFIHHNNIMRASISAKKDELIDKLVALSELKWHCDTDTHFYIQERYNAAVARIDWKLKQLNELSSCILVTEEALQPLYDFDVESFACETTPENDKNRLKNTLQEKCDTIIDIIETEHFTKVLRSKTHAFWSARHSLFGVLFALIVITLFIHIMSFLFK
ncbi:hypothetical protein ACVTEB_14440 [Vibrio cholerae]|nr:hypothetical protein [Vibrio cholerae]EGR0574336.1 hypothetical protein [Vibrio cholerae]EGR5459017.1 hypothetical protein [Vibrio cholerae]